MYAVPPVTSGRVTRPEGLDPCRPTDLRERRAARSPGNHGTYRLDQASNRTEDQPRSRIPVTGFRWEVTYRTGRRGTDMNGAFDRVALGPNIDPPDIRERARWQERPIKGDGERRNQQPMRLERR